MSDIVITDEMEPLSDELMEKITNELITEHNIGLSLVKEATKWLGVREEGNNAGPYVEMFQKAVDGIARNEPWCLSFVAYCAQQVAALYGVNALPLYPTEHCLTLWKNTPQKKKNNYGAPGHIAIWNIPGTRNGHAGICTAIKSNFFATIEGNTNSAGSREGDGVYRKLRPFASTPNWRLLGFINLPQIILEQTTSSDKLRAAIKTNQK